MKAFNLEEAINGALVYSAGDIGKYVLLNINDVDGDIYIFQFEINENGSQAIMSYHKKKGKWFHGINDGIFHGEVFMTSVKKELWVNLYKDERNTHYMKNEIYYSLQSALNNRHFPKDYIKSIKIYEYEE